jgi:hypothetical protein
MNSRKIKKFGFDGIIKDDASIPRMRSQYENMIVHSMRISGYVPVLDLDSQFHLEYDQNKDQYSFKIYVHGIFVGKKKSLQYEGFTGQRLIPRSDI